MVGDLDHRRIPAALRAVDDPEWICIDDERAVGVLGDVKELKRFERIALEPGEKKTLRFTFSKNDLSLYDDNMKWIFEPGWFKIFVGGNSEDVVGARIEVR